MIRIVASILSLVILFSCENKQTEPAGILKPAKMQAVLWDVMRADAFTTEFVKKDSSKNDVEENLKLQQEIFAIHHISREDFYKSYEYYKKNSAQMKTVIDSMISEAEKKQTPKISPLQAK
jgi:hypothetical protein